MTLKSGNPNLDCFKNPDISLYRLPRVLSFSALRKYTMLVCTNTVFSSQAFLWLFSLTGHAAVLQLSTYDNFNDSFFFFFHLFVGVFRSTENSKFCFPRDKLKLQKNCRVSPNTNHIDQLTAASAKRR